MADAAYDDEWVHEFLRDELDVRSIIPPTIGHPTDKPPTGRYRRPMTRFIERPRRHAALRTALAGADNVLSGTDGPHFSQP